MAIDQSAAIGVGLEWDPDTFIWMQSAHGGLRQTKGLTRNVPFRFGEITIYLQLHVVENAPYKVLLGRPFDAITRSQIRNYGDGDQLITITCPNSKLRCTIPTYARGRGIQMPPEPDETLHPESAGEAKKNRDQQEGPEQEEVNFQDSSMIW